jgi:hypothetical protein
LGHLEWGWHRLWVQNVQLRNMKYISREGVWKCTGNVSQSFICLDLLQANDWHGYYPIFKDETLHRCPVVIGNR